MTRGGGRGGKRIVWTDQALADLDDIGAYIARDDAHAAERWINRLVDAVERAALLPTPGRRVPELERDDIRESLVRTYRIVYWVQPDQLEVVTVFEGHRRLKPPGR